MSPVKVFIGYDPSETVAWHVLCHSIMSRASVPVSITPIMLSGLGDIHKRHRHPLQSTQFSFTRFLVPYLSDFKGTSVFVDCDMMFLSDVAELVEAHDELCPVSVVKHDHKPKSDVKMLGQTQTQYPKKNWSSVMVFSNSLCRQLTPHYVDDATGLQLHQFEWVGNRPIGELPHGWNHLVGYDPEPPSYKVHNIHWTEGGPWWKQYGNAPYSDLWRKEFEAMHEAWERLPAHLEPVR